MRLTRDDIVAKGPLGRRGGIQPQNDDGTPDESGVGAHMLDNALEALRWLEGESTVAPSKGWESLDRRKKK